MAAPHRMAFSGIEDYYCIDDEDTDTSGSSDCEGNEGGLVDAEIALESIERAVALERKGKTNGHGGKTLYKPVEGDGGGGEKSCHAERQTTCTSVRTSATTSTAASKSTSPRDEEARTSTTSSNGKSGKKEEKERRRQEEEDLLYDQSADEKDEMWLTRRRRGMFQEETNVTTSDAVLNCPCCFTLLCLDCQQHEVYKTQYRSMFVMNCTVDAGNPLQEETRSEEEGKKKKKEEKQRQQQQQEEEDREKRREMKAKRRKDSGKRDSQVYLNVRCSICQTQVAVYDEEQVYHFFNVLASHP